MTYSSSHLNGDWDRINEWVCMLVITGSKGIKSVLQLNNAVHEWWIEHLHCVCLFFSLLSILRRSFTRWPPQSYHPRHCYNNKHLISIQNLMSNIENIFNIEKREKNFIIIAFFIFALRIDYTLRTLHIYAAIIILYQSKRLYVEHRRDL